MTLLRPPQSFWRVLAILACLVAWGTAHAQALPRDALDHLKTGFVLDGAHARADCESCHVNGIFKGTPRDCASCHRANLRLGRGNVVMPLRHVPTQLGCESCHRTDTFVGARFNHAGVPGGACLTCHNGSTADGKPASHVPTTASCDSCHRTSGWVPAGFKHAGVTPGTCATCHNGSRAPSKPANHIPIAAASCDACHASFDAWRPTSWNHSQVVVVAQCASCHTGGYPPADGRPANHIPYQSVAAAAAANCDTCHKGGYASWSGGRLHANTSVSTGCFTCHTGSYVGAVGRPANAIHATVTGNCESCHRSTASWSAAAVDHSAFNATTNCITCHNGSTATAKPATHIPIGTTGCFACHNVSPASWTPTKWNHTQLVVAAQCASCHTGGYPPADGRPANHIPYQSVAAAAAANCDTCHKGSYSSWANGRMHAYVSVSTGCSACHSGSYLNATGKPANTTHATVTGNCESCHRSTTSWSSGVTFAHSAANAVGSGTCDGCHNGATAIGKPSTHIPVTTGSTACDSCHRSQSSFSSAVTMNHSVVTATPCRACHNGAYVSQGSSGALAKPANHVPEAQLLNGTSMDCSACHATKTSWGSMRMNHNASQGNGAGWCKACHQGGTVYLGSMERKPLTHRRTTGVTDCSQSGCHRPLGSTGAAYTRWD